MTGRQHRNRPARQDPAFGQTTRQALDMIHHLTRRQSPARGAIDDNNLVFAPHKTFEQFFGH